MATIRFFIRASKKTDKTSNIRVRLRHGKHDYYAILPYKIMSDHWNSNSQKVKQNSSAKYRVKINSELPRLEDFLLSEYGKSSNPDSLQRNWLQNCVDQRYKVNDETNVTLLGFIGSIIKKADNGVINPNTGRKYNERTLKKYKTTYKVLKEFSKYSNRVVDFETVNKGLYDAFVDYLTIDLNLATNTVGKYISNFKSFLRLANEYGYPVSIGSYFKVPSEESDNIHLNQEELNILYRLDLSHIKRLERIRDMFLIGAWTGLRFSDFTRISPENAQGEFIELRQFKTGGQVVLPKLFGVSYILEKYDYNLTKHITNQNFNKYIKESCKMAGLTQKISKSITKGGVRRTIQREKWELVTSHTARRSFATNAYNSGLDATNIMAITGHKSEREFYKYIKVSPKEYAQKMKLHYEGLSQLRAV